MNKLENKVFYTILGILTISVLSFIVVFNVQNYFEQKDAIIRNLNMNFFVNKNDNFPKMENDKNKFDNKIDTNIRFMDAVIYTVILDSNDNILDIVSHSRSSVESDIYEVAEEILNGDKKREFIGNLYFDDYSYSYNKGNNLTIVDNRNAKEILLGQIKTSLIILIVLEVVIVYISKLLTNWIIRPVSDAFNKQKEFIADASHELKTPLSVIVASSEALEANPKEKKWLLNIKNEADRMNNLITDLLDLAKTERDGSVELSMDNLSKAVELSVLTFEGRAYEKNIKLDYQIDDNILIKMNENSIRQLVEILLDNAIKHSSEKGIVKVNLKKNSNNIELLVTNEGEGIPRGEEERIFERFYRVDKSRNRSDNRYGLGLAIAKNIVKMHSGSISASSNNGITVFKVLFKK